MKKMWVVIYEDDDLIECVDVFDNYLKGVGAAYTRFLDSIDEMIKDGYQLVKKYEFNTLEGDTGYSWVAEIKRKRSDGSIYKYRFRYYLLRKEIKDGEE